MILFLNNIHLYLNNIFTFTINFFFYFITGHKKGEIFVHANINFNKTQKDKTIIFFLFNKKI